MTRQFRREIGAALLLLVGVAGCSALPQGEVADGIPRAAPEKGGTFNSDTSVFGEDGVLGAVFGRDGKGGSELPVNAFLWRASLDTLSAALPLESTDPFSGVITTDWGASPGAPNERVRAVARVTSKELSATALEVNVFRETLSPTGAWLAAETSGATRDALKDAILTRARQLRIESVDKG